MNANYAVTGPDRPLVFWPGSRIFYLELSQLSQ
jgi:hypothetical protein